MKHFTTLLILIFATLAPSAAAVTLKRQTTAAIEGAERMGRGESFWLGDYFFGEDGGKTTGGTAIFIVHSMGIHREAGGLIAEITSQGYQTSRSVTGVVKVTGNTARIYFKSYGEGNMYEPHREGDLLLTLKRVVQKGRTRILTYWNAFEPAAKPLASGRVYFKRGRV